MMKNQSILVLLVLACLLISFSLFISCGGGGSDDSEDERVAEFSCPDFELGENPYEQGTAECDATCLEWDGQWFLEVYRRYVECIGSVPLGDSDTTCAEAANTCLERTEKPKRQCAQ